MNEQLAEQAEAMSQEEQEYNLHLLETTKEALDMAINLGLPKPMVQLLCWHCGINANDFYEE